MLVDCPMCDTEFDSAEECGFCPCCGEDYDSLVGEDWNSDSSIFLKYLT